MSLRLIEVPTPHELGIDHARRGGMGLRRWCAALPGDVWLRIMHGREPIEEGGDRKRHLSFSIARSVDTVAPSIARPTDEEVREVLLQLFPACKFEEDNVGSQSHFIRHFWEA